MIRPMPPRSTCLLAALACGAGAAGWAPACAPALAAAASVPTAGAQVSTNWAGYVALSSAHSRTRFSSVSGSWREPQASCSAGVRAYSAVWVGLGGYARGARSLEQVGTDADCARSGVAQYSAWYELLPAAPVDLELRVRPGDELVASVTVRRRDATLRLADLTSGARMSITKHAARVDASSAEWIVEAPSACAGTSACTILPLADFGEVAFSAASATARSHTGPIGDPGWSASALELQQRALPGTRRNAGANVAPAGRLTLAVPSASSAPFGAFSVSWQQQTAQLEHQSPPTLPASAGGPP
jgi:Peptidase A4 family